jgi:hypothetical protein
MNPGSRVLPHTGPGFSRKARINATSETGRGSARNGSEEARSISPAPANQFDQWASMGIGQKRQYNLLNYN